MPVSATSALPAIGWSVAGVGDTDASGRTELVVGAPRDSLDMAREGLANLYRPFELTIPSSVPSTRLSFDLHRSNPGPAPIRLDVVTPDEGAFTIQLLDISGRTVESLEGRSPGSGRYPITLGTPALPPGVYLVCLDQGSHRVSAKAVVVH